MHVMRVSNRPRRAFLVAVVGVDGAGKTTLCREVVRLGVPGVRLHYLYMGHGEDFTRDLLPFGRWMLAARRMASARRSGASSDFARAAWRVVEGYLGSLIVLAMLLEEGVRQVVAMSHVARGRVVLADRHFFADYFGYEMTPEARRIHIANRLHGQVLRRLCPPPDLLVYLEAPRALIARRRSAESTERLGESRRGYAKLLAVLPDVRVIDAGRPLEEVVGEVRTAIAAYGARHEL